jgi:hypothetical protein
MSFRKRMLFIASAALALSLTLGIGPASPWSTTTPTASESSHRPSTSSARAFGVQGLGGRLVSEPPRREGGVAGYASIDNCD